MTNDLIEFRIPVARRCAFILLHLAFMILISKTLSDTTVPIELITLVLGLLTFGIGLLIEISYLLRGNPAIFRVNNDTLIVCNLLEQKTFSLQSVRLTANRILPFVGSVSISDGTNKVTISNLTLTVGGVRRLQNLLS